MIPFPTTKKQILKLDIIIEKLKQDDFDNEWISDVEKISKKDQGIFDLLELWFNEIDCYEKQETIKTIMQCMNDRYISWMGNVFEK